MLDVRSRETLNAQPPTPNAQQQPTLTLGRETKPMTTSLEAPQTANAAARLAGEVVYLFAFDVAYEMVRKPVPSLLGQPAADFAIGSSKRNPRQAFFFRAQMVRLPPLERLTPRGAVRLERSVKLLPVGAISLMI